MDEKVAKTPRPHMLDADEVAELLRIKKGSAYEVIYGFRNTDNLVALLMLRCGDCQPQLPGRPVKARKKGVKGAKSVAA